MSKTDVKATLYTRIEKAITNYITNRRVEISRGVFFSQYDTINRIYKFRNRDLSGTKFHADLSYDYYFDIISPRADSEVKNLRFDTKHILTFSLNPRKDFAVVFIANATLKSWMAENGEDEKLKSAVEEFTTNGNIGFKKTTDGYETVDPLNTYVTNEIAETIDDTDLVERHEMTASEILDMDEWDENAKKETIKKFKDKTFKAGKLTTSIDASKGTYEIFEFTGEVSEKELFQVQGGKDKGNPDKFMLAKVIVAGLESGGKSKKQTLFAEEMKGVMSDHYRYAHRGRYEGRFWRMGMYEMLFDYQIRANDIGNQLASGLEWASKVIFRSNDTKVMQNIRADLDNGDVIITEDLAQVDVRMRGLDQLIADWNRLSEDADRLSNSSDVVRGESSPSGTPFRLGALQDANAGKMFAILRQKLTLPYKRVFREWVLARLLKEMKGEDVFRLIGDEDMVMQLRVIMVDNWYIQNLLKIGPHTQDVANAIKAEKLEEMNEKDPVIVNTKEIWKGVKQRIMITITGENSDMADNLTDLTQLLQLETDPERIAFLLDSIYKIRGIPVPPKKEELPTVGESEQERLLKGQQAQKTSEQVQATQPAPQQ